MQSTTVQGTTVGVAQPPANGSQNMRLQAGATLGLGITQIVLGGICILASIIALAAGCDRDESKDHACGIWSGIFFAITGIIGIIAARTKANGAITAFMIMCIISSVLCLVTLSYGSASVSQARDEYDLYSFYTTDRCSGSPKDTSIAMGVILIIAALAEAIVAITASGIACGAVCCGTSSAGAVYVPSQATTTTYVIQSGNAPVAQPYPAGGYAQPANVPYYGPPGQYPMQQAPPQQYPPQQYPQAGGMMPPPYNEPTAQAVDHKQPSYNPEHPAQ